MENYKKTQQLTARCRVFAKMMDKLNEELENENSAAIYAGEKIPSLLLVDDVAVLANTRSEMKRMLQIVEELRRRHRLSLSQKKSKIIIVNADKQDNDTNWKIGEMKIDKVLNYPYLGETIDYKNKITPTIE